MHVPFICTILVYRFLQTGTTRRIRSLPNNMSMLWLLPSGITIRPFYFAYSFLKRRPLHAVSPYRFTFLPFLLPSPYTGGTYIMFWTWLGRLPGSSLLRCCGWAGDGAIAATVHYTVWMGITAFDLSMRLVAMQHEEQNFRLGLRAWTTN